MKPHTFGALRMHLANQGHNKSKFRDFLIKEGCDDKLMEEIRQAFLSIGTDHEVPNNKVFGEERK